MPVIVNSDFTIRINTGMQLSGSPVTDILYKKPNSDIEINAGGGIYNEIYIEADISDTTNDTAGKWLFRTHVLTSTGEHYYGPAVFINIDESWKPWQ